MADRTPKFGDKIMVRNPAGNWIPCRVHQVLPRGRVEAIGPRGARHWPREWRWPEAGEWDDR